MQREEPSLEAITPDQVWQILVEGGVPLGPAHARSRPPSGRELAAAVRSVMLAPKAPAGVSAEALHAALRAWHDHFPLSFEQELGPQGLSFLERLAPEIEDRNRYLKLRRIALAHLALIL